MTKKAFLIPYTFTLLNWAAVVGLYHFVHKTELADIWPEQHVQHGSATIQDVG